MYIGGTYSPESWFRIKRGHVPLSPYHHVVDSPILRTRNRVERRSFKLSKYILTTTCGSIFVL